MPDIIRSDYLMIGIILLLSAVVISLLADLVEALQGELEYQSQLFRALTDIRNALDRERRSSPHETR